jgi:hypothetical protein
MPFSQATVSSQSGLHHNSQPGDMVGAGVQQHTGGCHLFVLHHLSSSLKNSTQGPLAHNNI